VGEDFDQAVLGTVSQPPPDDFVSAPGICPFAAGVRVLVGEEHTAMLSHQAQRAA
jgi:hypothetical protein